jgi:tetratricopeptide (TPR) repeat protein
MKLVYIAMLVGLAAPLHAADPLEQARAAALTQPAESIALFEAQLGDFEQTPAWYQRDWLVLAARAYTRLKQFPQAEQRLRQADTLLSQGLGKTDLLLTAGFVNLMQQKYQAAFYWYQCSAQFDLPPTEQARVVMSLGQIAYLQHDFQQAGLHFQASLDIARQYQLKSLQALLQNNLGLVLWRQQQHAAAIRLLKQAIYGYTQLQEQYSLQMVSLNLLTVVVSQQDWPTYDRYVSRIANSIETGAPADLKHYLALLQALRHLGKPQQQPDLSQLTPLAKRLEIPGLVQNASWLLQPYGIVAPIFERPLAPMHDLRMPQLEQSCGAYAARP